MLIVQIMGKQEKLGQPGYTMLSCMPDPLESISNMQRATGKPEDFAGTKVRGLYQFMMVTYLGEEKLQVELEWPLWNPIFHSVVETLVFRDCENCVAWYMSMKQLLTSHSQAETNLRTSQAQIVIDDWLRWLLVVLRLKKRYLKELRLPKTDCQYPLSGHECPLQAEPKNLDRRMERSSGYWMLFSLQQMETLLVSEGAHEFFTSRKRQKEEVDKHSDDGRVSDSTILSLQWTKVAPMGFPSLEMQQHRLTLHRFDTRRAKP